MKYDAFISYRRGSGFPVAKLIRDQLKSRKINCYLDLEEDKAGKFNESLLAAIQTAPNFILIETKNSINRCVNSGDWVRREILAAVESKKTIIPVRYPGFIWPSKLNPKLPEIISQLETQQGVLFSEEYLDATVNKIISYMTHIEHANDLSFNRVPLKTDEFIQNGIRYPDIQCVDMAFHAGAEWRRDTVKLDVLKQIIDKKISLRVIVNKPEAIESVCSHMRHQLKKYVSFDESIGEWKDLEQIFPDSIQVRIIDLPLFHRLYIVRNSDGSGMVNIKYYSYGNYTTSRDVRQSFSSADNEYQLYVDEFDYLWNHACLDS